MNRKRLITAGIMILMLVAAGCSDQETTSQSAALPIAEEVNEDTVLPSQSDAADASPESDTSNNAPDILPLNVNSDATIIGGKVRSVAQDSFVISRTLWEDSDDGGSYVSIPEEGSPEEELVTIHCTDTTTFERWTIQGGGAGITTDEAAFSDIQRGGGLEAKGYFDGEEFIAERVIVEIYE